MAKVIMTVDNSASIRQMVNFTLSQAGYGRWMERTPFSDRINKEIAEAIGIKGFLMKPVVKSEMAQMVRKVLDDSKSSDQ